MFKKGQASLDCPFIIPFNISYNMRIVCKGPVRAPREPLARQGIDADEASVSRILPPSGYRGLVERLQRVEAQTEHRFWMDKQVYGQGQPSYHILRFLALGVARSLFPAHFVEGMELRMFVRGETQWSAMYSQYVHDERGAAARRRAHRRQFEGRPEYERPIMRVLADGIERKLTPGLLALASRIRQSGIVVAHPEANYHVNRGSIVFFEVQEVRGMPLLEAARRQDGQGNPEALRHAATLYTLAIKEWAGRGELRQTGGQQATAGFDRIQTAELFEIVYDVFANHPQKAAELIEAGADMVMESLDVLKTLTRSTRSRNRVRMACQIDPQVFRWI